MKIELAANFLYVHLVHSIHLLIHLHSDIYHSFKDLLIKNRLTSVTECFFYCIKILIGTCSNGNTEDSEVIKVGEW